MQSALDDTCWSSPDGGALLQYHCMVLYLVSRLLYLWVAQSALPLLSSCSAQHNSLYKCLTLLNVLSGQLGKQVSLPHQTCKPLNVEPTDGLMEGKWL